MAVDPIPSEHPRVCPYLIVDGASDAIKFYAGVFGTAERMRLPGPAGRLGHAELQLGGSVIMLADSHPEMGIRGPKDIGGSPITMAVYVENVDATFAAALAAGATSIQPVEDKFYGDRAGQFEDPFGHRWSVMSHIEDLTPRGDEPSRGAAAST